MIEMFCCLLRTAEKQTNSSIFLFCLIVHRHKLIPIKNLSKLEDDNDPLELGGLTFVSKFWVEVFKSKLGSYFVDFY
jgi:hypothetical protein